MMNAVNRIKRKALLILLVIIAITNINSNAQVLQTESSDCAKTVDKLISFHF